MGHGEYIKILREMASEMYEEVWSSYDRYSGKVSYSELGRILDYASANAAYRYIVREGLDLGVISEEWPAKRELKFPVLIVDPVDGTNNLSRGIRFSCISLSIALGDDLDSIVAGLVMDLFNKDIYWATRGGGAYRNGYRIGVNRPRDMRDLFVSVVIDRSIAKPAIMNLLSRVKILRFFGSSALELSLVASGHLDAFIDLRGKLRIYDFAPGYLLVKEAGGYVYTSYKDGSRPLVSKVEGYKIIASSSDWFLNKFLKTI